MLQMCFNACLIAAALCLVISLILLLRSRIVTERANSLSATSDLMDYATLADDQVIVLKTGALLSCFELKVPDLSLLPPSHLEHIYQLNQKALLKLGENYCIQVDVLRNQDHSYIPTLERNQCALSDIEARREHLFATQGSLKSRIILSITYMGNNAQSRSLEHLVLQDFNSPDHYAEALNLVNEFKSACQCVVDTLEHNMQVTPLTSKALSLKDISTSVSQGEIMQDSLLPAMSSDQQVHKHSKQPDSINPHNQHLPAVQEISSGGSKIEEHVFAHEACYHEALSFINQCWCAQERKIATPMARAYLDSVLGNYDLICGDTLKVGSKLISVLAIEGLPASSHEGMLNALATLPFCYRYNTRFIYFDHFKSRTMLDKYRRFWAQKSKGIMAQLFNLEHARVNQNALDQIKDIDEATRALDNNEVIFGSYTATMILADENWDNLLNKTKQAIKAIESVGLSVRVETLNAPDAFLGSQPGHFFENLRRPIVSQDVLLDLIPLTLPITGERYCPNVMYGPKRSPLMQVRTAGHGCYYLNLHNQDIGNTLVVGPTGAGKSVFLGSLILNLSRYHDMKLFVFDKGYSFYALTKALQGSHLTFNNSQALLCPLHKLESELDRDYALSFLELLLQLNNYTMSPKDKSELRECLTILAGKEPYERSLSDLHITLSNNKLKDALAPYTKVNAQNCILDGTDNVLIQNKLTTFECADIFKSSPAFALPVLKQVFHLIEEQFDGHPGAIILDEAWLMLQNEHFASELIKWFKTLRKFNVMVILATQSLSDLQSSPHFLNLLECAPTRVYLPNYDANNELLHQTYEIMGLSDAEINQLTTAVPKQDYYFVKNDQRIMVKLELSPEELNLLSFAGDFQVDAINQLYERFGPLFYTHYQDCNAKTLTAA